MQNNRQQNRQQTNRTDKNDSRTQLTEQTTEHKTHTTPPTLQKARYFITRRGQRYYSTRPKGPPSPFKNTTKQLKTACLSNGHTVLGNVSRLATRVARLGQLVGRCRAFLGNMAALAARVALHSVGLAVLGEVVGATALVARGALAVESGLSYWRWNTLVLRTVARNVAKLEAVVALGALGTVGAVALHVAHVATGVALLRVGGLWLGAGTGLVAGLATVVAQTLGLLTVVGDVAGFTALVTGSGEHGC